jgi:peptidoglycan hydrolase CwlO-like protein
MVLAITLFGSGISWSIQTTHFIQKKTESISKSVYGVQQSIDKLGNSVNQVNETKDKVENGVGKVTKPIEDADKAVKKKIYKYTSPIFGEPSKELKD